MKNQIFFPKYSKYLSYSDIYYNYEDSSENIFIKIENMWNDTFNDISNCNKYPLDEPSGGYGMNTLFLTKSTINAIPPQYLNNPNAKIFMYDMNRNNYANSTMNISEKKDKLIEYLNYLKELSNDQYNNNNKWLLYETNTATATGIGDGNIYDTYYIEDYNANKTSEDNKNSLINDISNNFDIIFDVLNTISYSDFDNYMSLNESQNSIDISEVYIKMLEIRTIYAEENYPEIIDTLNIEHKEASIDTGEYTLKYDIPNDDLIEDYKKIILNSINYSNGNNKSNMLYRYKNKGVDSFMDSYVSYYDIEKDIDDLSFNDFINKYNLFVKDTNEETDEINTYNYTTLNL